jgi:hypothetical protein
VYFDHKVHMSLNSVDLESNKNTCNKKRLETNESCTFTDASVDPDEFEQSQIKMRNSRYFFLTNAGSQIKISARGSSKKIVSPCLERRMIDDPTLGLKTKKPYNKRNETSLGGSTQLNASFYKKPELGAEYLRQRKTPSVKDL